MGENRKIGNRKHAIRNGGLGNKEMVIRGMGRGREDCLERETLREEVGSKGNEEIREWEEEMEIGCRKWKGKLKENGKRKGKLVVRKEN